MHSPTPRGNGSTGRHSDEGEEAHPFLQTFALNALSKNG
jgi:hypothetical protein